MKLGVFTRESTCSSAEPFWSVMVPAYNPDAMLLRDTLESVLAQDPGPAEMQIAVVDDCSPRGVLADLVEQYEGRVELFQNARNLGLAGTWNRCIEQARGTWIHVLHQDDVVRPGFYQALRNGILAAPQVGAAFCRYAYIDSQGAETGLGEGLAQTAGILAGLELSLIRSNKIQCACIAVRRTTYDDVGLFDSQWPYVVDWDMWFRIARSCPVWYDPQVLACFRRHGTSTTTRLQREGRDLKDISKFLNLARELLNDPEGDLAVSEARRTYARRAVNIANQLLDCRAYSAGVRQLLGAWRLGPCPSLLAGTARFAYRLLNPKTLPHRMRINTQPRPKT